MAMGYILPRERPLERGQPLRSVVSGFLHLIVPAIFLVAIYVLTFYLLQNPVWFSVGPENELSNPIWWMSLGHLTLALVFFAVTLTNRAHGPTRAFFHVIFAWAIMVGLLGFASSIYGLDTVRAELMPTKVMAAFLGALFAGHIAAIVTFDWQRGVPWWKAPLLSAFIGPLVFVLIFYPLGHAGMDVPWASWMWMHFLAMAFVGLVMLVPYAMLRKMIKPEPGLGGA